MRFDAKIDQFWEVSIHCLSHSPALNWLKWSKFQILWFWNRMFLYAVQVKVQNIGLLTYVPAYYKYGIHWHSQMMSITHNGLMLIRNPSGTEWIYRGVMKRVIFSVLVPHVRLSLHLLNLKKKMLLVGVSVQHNVTTILNRNEICYLLLCVGNIHYTTLHYTTVGVCLLQFRCV